MPATEKTHTENTQISFSVFSVCILQWPALSVVACNFGIGDKGRQLAGNVQPAFCWSGHIRLARSSVIQINIRPRNIHTAAGETPNASSCFGPGNPMSASWERRRLADKGIAITARFVLALFGTLRLSPKALVGFILLPPGRRRSQDGFGSIATSERVARFVGL